MSTFSTCSTPRDFNSTKARTDGTIADVIWLQQIAGLIVLLLGVGVAYLMGRSIVNPLTALTGAMRELAGGNFERKAIVGGILFKDAVARIDKPPAGRADDKQAV